MRSHARAPHAARRPRVPRPPSSLARALRPFSGLRRSAARGRRSPRAALNYSSAGRYWMYPPPAPRGAVVQCYPRSARAARPSSSRPSSPKPGQRRGITFPLSSGHFTLAWVPPSIPEPREPSLPPGIAGIRGVREEPARPLREPRGQRSPRLPPASSSYQRVTERGCGWPRLRCAYRAQALPMPWSPRLLWALFCTTPPNGGLCACACPPSFSALPPLGTRVIGTDRNSESF